TPSLSEITVTKDLDQANSELVRQALWGEGKKVVIDFVADDSKNDVPYLSLELENTLISNYTVSGHGGFAHSGPMESMSLNTTKLTYSTAPVEASKDPKHLKDRATWNIAAGRSKSP